MMILLSLVFTYPRIAWDIPPFMSFSTINNISGWVNSYKFTFVFFKATCHANPGAERKWAGSSLHILRHFGSF